MNGNIKIFFLIILFILSSLSFVSIESQSQQSLGGATYFDKNIYPVAFSIQANTSQSSVNIFSIYQTNNIMLHLESDSISPLNVASEGGTNIPIENIIASSKFIIDENYYNTNGQQLVILSVKSINNNFLLVIKNMETNQTFIAQGLSAYHISLVTSFDNSADVYFSFYNETMFTIAKYSLGNDNFSIAFHTLNLNINSQYLTNISSFYLNNKIYSSMVIRTNIPSPKSFNSTIIILNSTGIVFNKTLSNFECNYITPTDTGLLLYSQTDRYFYNFQFTTNTNSSIQIQKTDYILSNIELLKPFNDNSLMIITSDKLIFESFSISQNNITLDVTSEYSFNYANNLTLYAFNMNSAKYYVMGIYLNSIDQFSISANNYDATPVDLSLTTLIASPNAPLSHTITSISNPITSSTITQSTSSNSIIFILILIIVAFAGVTVYYNKSKRIKLNYQPKNTMTVQKNTNKTNLILITGSCSKCGALPLSGDVFCQNCGTKL